ncbi:MAG: signal peptidase II [Evtepia gabavorous]
MPLYFLLAAALVAVDQVVKYLVRAGIPLHTAVDFLPGLDLTYVQNTGAAFSLFSQHTWLLTLLSGVVSVVLVICLGKRVLPHWSGMLALALLLGGAVGNFIDRLLFGFVTDMFATTFVNFAVFNVADVGVVLGGVLLCLHLIVFSAGRERRNRTRRRPHERHPVCGDRRPAGGPVPGGPPGRAHPLRGPKTPGGGPCPLPGPAPEKE